MTCMMIKWIQVPTGRYFLITFLVCRICALYNTCIGAFPVCIEAQLKIFMYFFACRTKKNLHLGKPKSCLVILSRSTLQDGRPTIYSSNCHKILFLKIFITSDVCELNLYYLSAFCGGWSFVLDLGYTITCRSWTTIELKQHSDQTKQQRGMAQALIFPICIFTLTSEMSPWIKDTFLGHGQQLSEILSLTISNIT